MKEKSFIDPVAKDLTATFGPVDMISPWFSFDFTTYYEPEMGTPLFRRLLVFKTLIEQNALPEIKTATNALEQKYSKNARRMVNLDPGYMLRERFVLATGKNFSHRIYLDKGIYADLALIYIKGRFQKLSWTYPDYANENMLIYLESVRNKYVVDLKQEVRNDI
jgi:hypothetical protein